MNYYIATADDASLPKYMGHGHSIHNAIELLYRGRLYHM